MLQDIKIINVIVMFVAYLVGMKFPDWDFKFKLKHRNILTHSPLLLFVFVFYYMKTPEETLRYFIMGFALAMGVHFVFDLFPKGWGGGALIHLPIGGLYFKPEASKIILRSSSLIAFLIAVFYTKQTTEFLILFILGGLTIFINIFKEKKLIRPLFGFLVIYLLCGSLKYPAVKIYLLDNVEKIINKI